ncbi:MAG: dihydropteroate synthase [Syntrophobacteraceae bacterium]|jgi:5-methyltetrahydrofolate--homocysteine methyltransferase
MVKTGAGAPAALKGHWFMLIIGERINSTRKGIEQAIRKRDRDAIVSESLRQAEAGANFLDVNCGTLDAADEPAALEWLVRVVQDSVDLPLCIDSPNPDALAAGLAVHRGEPIINSISGESERFKKVLPLIKQYNGAVVALCLDDGGIPPDRNTAIEVGGGLVGALTDAGVPIDKIYLDPLVRSVATSPLTVLDTLAVIETLRVKYPGLHFVSGLSNVSYGLPERRHLNRAYVVMSIVSGLDAVIMDPLDDLMHALIYAAEALVNQDRFCLKYIKAYQEKKLSFDRN